MRISIGPRPVVAVRPEMEVHRPPDEYVSLLTKTEVEFRQYIRDTESDAVFKKLLGEGRVKKINFRGRVPHHLYQEFQDGEFMEFLGKYSVTDKVDWESDFFDKRARSRVEELALKYKVPRGELAKSLEYCRHLRLSWDGYEAWVSNTSPNPERHDRFRVPVAPQASVLSDESLAILADLLERYSITEVQFVERFLSVSPEPFEIARDMKIPVNAVEDILEVLEKVQIMSSMQVNVVDHHGRTGRPEAHSLAVVKRMKDPPRAEIQIDAKEQYSSRYDVKKPDQHTSKEEAAIMTKLRMINQRRTLAFRLVGFIYEFQYQYFASGNALCLKPLNQARIAKEMGEHESTVSRMLANKSLETPEGVLPLKFFCQSKKEVIERIIQIREKSELAEATRMKPFSDHEIANILEKEYDAKISRRTVTYYRNKIEGAPKFYVRSKKHC